LSCSSGIVGSHFPCGARRYVDRKSFNMTDGTMRRQNHEEDIVVGIHRFGSPLHVVAVIFKLASSRLFVLAPAVIGRNDRRVASLSNML
jgi:orotate phosphoribosyltransferase-like protein